MIGRLISRLKMESFQAYKLNAEQKLKVADHLLSTTYSIVKEPKLLISVIENLFQALDLTITGLLEFEKNFRSIGSIGESFESRIELFRRKIMSKYSISHEFIDFVTEIKSTLEQHKKSITEFTKKDKFVISDNEYNLKTLTEEDVKIRLQKAKQYINALFDITKKYS